MQTIELKGNDELKVSFVKFLLKQNYMHKKNEFNQVSLMGLSVFGVADKPKAGSRRPSRSDDNSIVPRRQDLAFLMYTDKDVAEVISSGLKCEKKCNLALFRNKRFSLNEMFQRNASKFAIFYV